MDRRGDFQFLGLIVAVLKESLGTNITLCFKILQFSSCVVPEIFYQQLKYYYNSFSFI